MNIAELDAIDLLIPTAETNDSGVADLEEPSLDSLEAAVEDFSSSADLESERDGDELAAARPSGYRKLKSDDAVGAFFKEMARYPLLKPNEEVELAHRIRF